MTLNTAVVSKGDFAQIMGVSPGRVSQYIAEGKIFGDALEGTGRLARIRVEIARGQLHKTIDPDQRFGANGKVLRGDVLPVPSISHETLFDRPPERQRSTSPTLIDDDVDELAQLRLRRERIKTEQAEDQRKMEKGLYTPSVIARQETTKAVAAAFTVMDAAIEKMAEAVAKQFSVPMRDVQQELIHAFREVREEYAKKYRAAATAEPQFLEDISDDDASEPEEDGA